MPVWVNSCGESRYESLGAELLRDEVANSKGSR